jgi:integrase
MKAGNVPRDITPHILRHSFASLASDMGYSDATIAVLLGHKGATVTSRYIHVADAALIAAADRLAQRIDALSQGVTLQPSKN